MDTDIWQELNDAWREYFKLSIWKNEHMIKPLFHCWVGVHLTKNYKIYFAGHEKSFRIHPFMIQGSGTGKSMAMKTTHFLLKKLGYNTFYTLSVNSSALMGNVTVNKTGQVIKTYGLLRDKDVIFWDEGSVLLKSLPNSEIMTDVLQTALDDKGFVSRAMAAGQLEYSTDITVCAGSYIEGSVENTILRKGLFQRMWLVFHKNNVDENVDLIENKYSLMSVNYHQKLELMEKMQMLLQQALPASQSVTVDACDYKEFMNEAKEYLIRNLKAKTFKDRKEDILGSFINRNDMIQVIAGQRALLMGRIIVTADDLKYGFECYKEHVRSAVELLQEGERVKPDRTEERTEIVLDIVRTSPLLYNVTKLAEELIQRKDWDMAQTRTYNFIHRLIKDGTLEGKHSGETGRSLMLFAGKVK